MIVYNTVGVIEPNSIVKTYKYKWAIGAAKYPNVGYVFNDYPFGPSTLNIWTSGVGLK